MPQKAKKRSLTSADARAEIGKKGKGENEKGPGKERGSPPPPPPVKKRVCKTTAKTPTLTSSMARGRTTITTTTVESIDEHPPTFEHPIIIEADPNKMFDFEDDYTFFYVHARLTNPDNSKDHVDYFLNKCYINVLLRHLLKALCHCLCPCL